MQKFLLLLYSLLSFSYISGKYQRTILYNNSKTKALLGTFQRYGFFMPYYNSSFPRNPQIHGKVSNQHKLGCNLLELHINNARIQNNKTPLKCDKVLRAVSKAHLKNQQDYGSFRISNSCNEHSWGGNLQCCYTKGGDNANCMWDKPKVT